MKMEYSTSEVRSSRHLAKLKQLLGRSLIVGIMLVFSMSIGTSVYGQHVSAVAASEEALLAEADNSPEFEELKRVYQAQMAAPQAPRLGACLTGAPLWPGDDGLQWMLDQEFKKIKNIDSRQERTSAPVLLKMNMFLDQITKNKEKRKKAQEGGNLSYMLFPMLTLCNANPLVKPTKAQHDYEVISVVRYDLADRGSYKSTVDIAQSIQTGIGCERLYEGVYVLRGEGIERPWYEVSPKHKKLAKVAIKKMVDKQYSQSKQKEKRRNNATKSDHELGRDCHLLRGGVGLGAIPAALLKGEMTDLIEKKISEALGVPIGQLRDSGDYLQNNPKARRFLERMAIAFNDESMYRANRVEDLVEKVFNSMNKRGKYLTICRTYLRHGGTPARFDGISVYAHTRKNKEIINTGDISGIYGAMSVRESDGVFRVTRGYAKFGGGGTARVPFNSDREFSPITPVGGR